MVPKGPEVRFLPFTKLGAQNKSLVQVGKKKGSDSSVFVPLGLWTLTMATAYVEPSARCLARVNTGCMTADNVTTSWGKLSPVPTLHGQSASGLPGTETKWGNEVHLLPSLCTPRHLLSNSRKRNHFPLPLITEAE